VIRVPRRAYGRRTNQAARTVFTVDKVAMANRSFPRWPFEQRKALRNLNSIYSPNPAMTLTTLLPLTLTPALTL
jgi:hypothetical protein